MNQITKSILISLFISFLFIDFNLSTTTTTSIKEKAKLNTQKLLKSNLISTDQELTENIEKIYILQKNVSADTNITVNSWKQYLQNLTSLTSYLIGKESSISYYTATDVTDASIIILDRLIPFPQIWAQLDRKTRMNSATQIFSIVERISILMNIQLSINLKETYHCSKTNIRLTTNEFSSNDISFTFGDVSVHLPRKALNGSESVSAATAVIFYGLREFISADKTNVYSNMIAVKVADKRSSVVLNEPYKLQIKMFPSDSKKQSQIATQKCVFWDFTKNFWSGKGCTFHLTDFYRMSCECDHLTNFGLLSELNETETSNDPEEIAHEIEEILEQIIAASYNITLEDWRDTLTRVTELVDNVTQDSVIETVDRPFALKVTTSSLDSFNRLIEVPRIWRKLTSHERRHSSTRIFKSISNLSVLMNAKQNETQTTEIDFSSISLQSKLFSVTNNESKNIHFEFSDIQLEIPFAAFNISKQIFNLKNETISTSASIVKTISEYLTIGTLVPNSQVLSVIVENNRESIDLNVPNKLKFTTKNLISLMFRDKPDCSFWNLTTQTWSTSGCQLLADQSNRKVTVCECDHLTNFAAIMNISNREEPSLAKSILTYFCSSITCLFLIASLFISLKYNRKNYILHDDQFKVKANRFGLNLSISIWLLISHLLIMVGMDRTEVQTICSINSLILLYSLLTAFSFMLMLSIHLYLSTSKRHLFRYFSFRNFALFAYIFPLAIIVISLFFIWILETKNIQNLVKSLTGEYFCWISSSKYPNHIWIFVAPVTLIIIVNCYLLVGILLSIVRLKSQSKLFKGKESQYVNPYTVYILLFNFGIPWILYIFYINEYMATIFSYIFIIVNGTQGIALFAEQYYVYWSNKQRDAKRRPSDTTKSSKFSLSTSIVSLRNNITRKMT